MRLAVAFVVIVVGLLAASAQAQLLRVTSPNNGDFLGRTNQVRFTITGATAQARVVATVINAATAQQLIQVEGRFDPNPAGEINGSLDMNFSESTPIATYRIRVEHFQGGNSVGTQTVDNVNIDVRRPKFLDVTPANAAFVRGLVPIRATIDEQNIDRWTVTVENQSIPNNTGTTSLLNVLWDTSGIEVDGTKTIEIRVEDRARNVGTVSRVVNVDRIPPDIRILSPGTTSFRPNTTIPVSVDIRDVSESSVHVAGVNVVMRTMDGRFIARVARRAARNSGGTLQWQGRIRATRNLPDQFRIVVTAVDRAGNPARTQEVVVTIAGRGR